ncbi:MAG: hypothetical protein A2W05_02170 [Candidatus Schekmanbacteria bacterium RBG_16_38_10]|uniref:Uncharacterized protein n=1 Tax=Candidatus Schekmanbacteria bacterium RBG_16_38_10 TaxID=1817879 RepID=A0A1F7RZ39_9BACT|nr:MAG: hypothetical protein A2W05_02170 [Candidatus Schekmanbacteria bacterium RBG_16_38_10]
MKNKSFIFVLAILISLIWSSQGFSLKEDTHKAINEHVAQNTVNDFSLNTYLRDNLGFDRGTVEVLKGVDAGGRNIEQKVFWWLGYGGEQEDRPGSVTDYLLGKPTRSVNHFHNPLLPWDQAGLDDSVFGISFTGQSSVLWSQRPIGTQSPGGYYSWHDAREYFYRALTSGSQTDREKNFADTFRAVGQLMHLVEDASVAMHTRNDIHILYSYEGYVENIRNGESNTFNSWTANAIDFDKSILSLAQNPLAPIPIARIIDTDSYDGTNPGITNGLNIGISEYTNANFFSDDTINSSSFPYPQTGGMPIVERNFTNTLWNTTYPRQYYLKNCCGETNGGQGYLLSAVDYLDYYRQQYPLLSFALPKIPVLDNNVYSDYASLLIPRAVGYSAGLLNYFFRGTLEITMPDSYIYSITDGSIIPQQFTRLKAKVRNTTPNENVQNCDIQQQNCILQAVARYKKRTDYQPDLSTDPPTASSREPNFSYSVSAPIVITSLSSTTPAEFTFDFTTNPIPAGITDLYLHVVFKGTLGNEANIAIAVGMKDLNEPQHFSIWNATDRFYLDGVLRTANEIRNDPSLLARVDFNGNGIANEAGEPYIDPYDVTTEIAFYPTGVTPTIYNATFTPLPSGRYGRIIILTDMPTFYILIHRLSTNPPDENTADFLFSGVINQDDINGTFQNTQVITFRGIIQHTWSAYARYYPNSVGISTAPWPVPANINPYPATTLYP